MRSTALRLARGGLNTPRVGKDVLQNALLYSDRSASKEGTSPHSAQGPLHNWPVTVKDNFCTLDMPTACSSKMLLDYQSPIEATAVTLLRQSGANIVAKTNCDEFGMGSANLYSVHGHVVNPEGLASGEPRVAGGSSGGAAAAVACQASRIALASDTGGSIRIPAAYCGVYGLKPSYGLISRWGLVAYADSLDTVGLIGCDSEDIRTAFNVISQHDRRDPTSIPIHTRRQAEEQAKEVFRRLQQGKDSLTGLRVGVPAESFSTELSKSMLAPLRQTLSKLKSLGAEIVSVKLPCTRYALSAYYVLASAEASSNLARYDGIRYGHRAEKQAQSTSHSATGSTPFHAHISKTRSEAFGEEVKKRILLGTYSLTSDLFDNYFLQAQKVRRLIRRDFDAAFGKPNALSKSPISSSQGVDILVTPSAIGIAPTIEEARSMGTKAYTQDLLTVPASLAGVPAMTLPAGRVDGLPVGVTLTAQWGEEEVLFHLANILSQA